MTTIVLSHPHDTCIKFQVFAVEESSRDHQVFAFQEFAAQDDAERVARQMMEVFEADHFRRVVCSGEKIG